MEKVKEVEEEEEKVREEVIEEVGCTWWTSFSEGGFARLCLSQDSLG